MKEKLEEGERCVDRRLDRIYDSLDQVVDRKLLQWEVKESDMKNESKRIYLKIEFDNFLRALKCKMVSVKLGVESMEVEFVEEDGNLKILEFKVVKE